MADLLPFFIVKCKIFLFCSLYYCKLCSHCTEASGCSYIHFEINILKKYLYHPCYVRQKYFVCIIVWTFFLWFWHRCKLHRFLFLSILLYQCFSQLLPCNQLFIPTTRIKQNSIWFSLIIQISISDPHIIVYNAEHINGHVLIPPLNSFCCWFL